MIGSRLQNNKMLAVVLCCVIAGAVVLVVRGWQSRGPTYHWSDHYRAVGRVIGEEVARQLGAGDGIVVQCYGGPNPVLDQALDVLKHDGHGVLATEIVAASTEPITTDARYAELCQKYPQAAAILTYSSDPYFAQPTPAALPRPHPRLIVIGTNAAQMQRYCDAGWVSLAFVPRQGQAGHPASPPKNDREEFAESFQIIRPRQMP